MKITSKGQVTIPRRIRENLGLRPGTEVEFVLDDNSVRIRKVQRTREASRGQSTVRRLRGRAAVKMTTDKILALTRDTP